MLNYQFSVFIAVPCAKVEIIKNDFFTELLNIKNTQRKRCVFLVAINFEESV